MPTNGLANSRSARFAAQGDATVQQGGLQAKFGKTLATPSSDDPCFIPPGGPGKAKLDADIRESLAQNSPLSFFDYGMSPGEKADWLIAHVKDGGDWDFKANPAYPDGRRFGDFHYGAVASALFGTHAASYGAHLYSLLKHGTLEDQTPQIRSGYAYTANRCYEQ